MIGASLFGIPVPAPLVLTTSDISTIISTILLLEDFDSHAVGGTLTIEQMQSEVCRPVVLDRRNMHDLTAVRQREHAILNN